MKNHVAAVAAASLLVLTGACASSSEVPSPAPATPDAEPLPAPGAAKRKPPVEGELISPVIAFRGKGPEWNLEVQNTGGWTHKATWAWGTGPAATGTLVYAPGDDGGLHLDGTLTTTEGDRPTKVTLTPGDCVDADNVHHDHAVTVAIAGLDKVTGCGDLAK